MDITRSCKGRAWLDADIVLNQKVPVGDVVAFPSQQTTMTNARMQPGCSNAFVFGQALPQGAVVQGWTWKATIEALEPEFDANGVHSVKKNAYQLSHANPSNGKFSGGLQLSDGLPAALVVTRLGRQCGSTTPVLPASASSDFLSRHQMKINSLINTGDPNRLRGNPGERVMREDARNAPRIIERNTLQERNR